MNNYPSQPRLLTVGPENGDILKKLKNGSILFCPRTSHRLPFKRRVIQPNRIFDLVPKTVDGLLDDLIPGSQLCDAFISEFETFSISSLDSNKALLYGQWVYFINEDSLARFMDKYWHRLALVTRNSTLLLDPEMNLNWYTVRSIFENAVIAIAGCSVGNGVAHAIARDIRPFRMKIADHKDYHLTNANRIYLTYRDLGKNKAIVTAEQLHTIDPFMEIFLFTDGVHEGNADTFINGDKNTSEPPSNIIIEETDDPDMKIFIRERARAYGIPVVMVSDIGSAVQVDIRRFDLHKDLPLAAGNISDSELYKRRSAWLKDLSNRTRFFEFAFALIGQYYTNSTEFKKIVLKEEEPLFAGIPQLGSTAMMAGGVAGETVARLLLGFTLPERMFINKHTGKIFIEGGI